MRNTINFNGSKFPPAFGYLEAWNVCEDANNEHPTWNIEFQYDSKGNFSYSSFNATTDQLKEAIDAKLSTLQGPKQLPAFSFPLTQAVQLDQNNTIVFGKKNE